jgi:hypothetical protein
MDMAAQETADMMSKVTARDEMSSSLTLAEAEMADGETLIWADISAPGAARRRVLPLSLLGWLLLFLGLIWMVKAAGASVSLLILGAPFLLSALALALLPWIWPLITRHTVYALSDRRLLAIQAWPKRRVTSYGPDDIDVVERRDYKDGTGDVVFRREEQRKRGHPHDPHTNRRVSERPVGFFGIPEARRVETAIWALKERRALPTSWQNRPKRENKADTSTQNVLNEGKTP